MKIIATLMGLGLLVNGLLMLRDPRWWYGAVSTVSLGDVPYPRPSHQ